ncbi:class I SAM-dependent methyltransferase [Rossellomorea aquimaris]|uniref:class I SAM-dependent methyltransferase n=1 Tax=Rossellomorea aquimaris TaxID=189382 RepID=UPI001CD7F836|nr:class I SAM-dependent methyltransferase [Rossellomorea aquimaris]MCA1053784.1 class I SAM-dependent methyltransferase [Rossellomorea aquimaris]
MKETIHNEEELFDMLDTYIREPEEFWTDFYRDRDKQIPFFKNIPDELLVSIHKDGIITKGKALELGCGPGRNAIYLAENGWEVDAVDISMTSLQWGEERALEKGVSVNFIHDNIFKMHVEEGAYDLVFDSGCFHHIAPHRRLSYTRLVDRALKKGGHLALTAFMKGGSFGGADMSDWDVYRTGSLRGGMGYDKKQLMEIFSRFEAVDIRLMEDLDESQGMFALSGLIKAFFRKE